MALHNFSDLTRQTAFMRLWYLRLASISAPNQLGDFESVATAEVKGPVGSVLMGSAVTLRVAAAWLRYFTELAGRDRL